MTKRHRTWRVDLGIRAAGSAACALSDVAFAHLLRLHGIDPAHGTSGPAAYLLTAFGFLCASAGTGLLALGSHLFDEVVVSERWQAQPGVRRSGGNGEVSLDLVASIRPSVRSLPLKAHEPTTIVVPPTSPMTRR